MVATCSQCGGVEGGCIYCDYRRVRATPCPLPAAGISLYAAKCADCEIHFHPVYVVTEDPEAPPEEDPPESCIACEGVEPITWELILANPVPES